MTTPDTYLRVVNVASKPKALPGSELAARLCGARIQATMRDDHSWRSHAMTKASSKRGAVVMSGVLFLCLWLGGCSSGATLIVRPTTPAPAELVPTNQLHANAYRRVLLLPPETGLKVAADVDVTVARERGLSHYMGKLEKLLIGHGFEIVAPEIVARLAQGKSQPGATTAARALVMGKETHADAVLMVQSLAVVKDTKYFHIEDLSEVEPRLRVEEDGEFTHRDTGSCLYLLPYYEIRLEAKMIDVRTGDVLWVGAARETSIDAFKESWTAKLDDECEVDEEGPFVYREELQSEATFDRTLAGLYDRLFTPLKKAALAGKPISHEEPKPQVVVIKEPPPKPEPPKVVEPPPPPPPKLAVVSSNNASLREGPGKRDRRMKNVPRKAKVEVVEVMGEWIKVKVQDGTVGWMHEGTLILPE